MAKLQIPKQYNRNIGRNATVKERARGEKTARSFTLAIRPVVAQAAKCKFSGIEAFKTR